MGGRIKVLYIAGPGRSGSTLLSNILGQFPGLVSVGELYKLWSRGVIDNRPCGCGQFLSECEFWRNVLNHLHNSNIDLATDELAELFYQESRQKNLFQMHRSLHTKKITPRLRKLLDVLYTLYSTIYTVSGGSIIIDSSKSPIYAAALKQLTDIDVYIIHLLRDPRPIAYSWMRPKDYLETHSALFSSLIWNLWNLSIEDLRLYQPTHYYRLRYEDFVMNPKQTISEILDFVNVPFSHSPFVANDTVDLSVTHNVFGNPNRFTTGPVQIRQDDRWINNMSIFQNALVTMSTWPFLLRYHYKI